VKKNISTIIAVCIFIGGLALFLYPTVSNFYNERFNAGQIDQYIDDTDNLSSSAYDYIIEQARLYNENLDNPAALQALGLEYEKMLDPHDTGVMGFIEIPKIRVELVIVHDVDESQLQNSVGHMQSTSLPVGGKGTHAAMAGHRGLPSAELLTHLDQLDFGDVFYIHVLDEVLEYRVDSIAVVEPTEMDMLRIEEDKDYVTLVTCTPYGINSHRLLVRGARVDGDEESSYTGAEQIYVPNELVEIKQIYFVPVIVLVMVLAVLTAVLVRKIIRKSERED